MNDDGRDIHFYDSLSCLVHVEIKVDILLMCKAAFLLPVLTGMLRNGIAGGTFSVIQEPQTVVIGPTRELVTQIHHEACKFAYNTMARSVVVYGGVSSNFQAREVAKGAHMVVGTPGRLMDFVRRGYVSHRHCYQPIVTSIAK